MRIFFIRTVVVASMLAMGCFYYPVESRACGLFGQSPSTPLPATAAYSSNRLSTSSYYRPSASFYAPSSAACYPSSGYTAVTTYRPSFRDWWRSRPRLFGWLFRPRSTSRQPYAYPMSNACPTTSNACCPTNACATTGYSSSGSALNDPFLNSQIDYGSNCSSCQSSSSSTFENPSTEKFENPYSYVPSPGEGPLVAPTTDLPNKTFVPETLRKEPYPPVDATDLGPDVNESTGPNLSRFPYQTRSGAQVFPIPYRLQPAAKTTSRPVRRVSYRHEEPINRPTSALPPKLDFSGWRASND